MVSNLNIATAPFCRLLAAIVPFGLLPGDVTLTQEGAEEEEQPDGGSCADPANCPLLDAREQTGDGSQNRGGDEVSQKQCHDFLLSPLIKHLFGARVNLESFCALL